MTPWSERDIAPADADGIVRLVRVAAYAVCRDGERILCCRLAPGEPSPGSWTLPGGGIDFGERPDDAVLERVVTMMRAALAIAFSDDQGRAGGEGQAFAAAG